MWGREIQLCCVCVNNKNNKANSKKKKKQYRLSQSKVLVAMRKEPPVQNMKALAVLCLCATKQNTPHIITLMKLTLSPDNVILHFTSSHILSSPHSHSGRGRSPLPPRILSLYYHPDHYLYFLFFNPHTETLVRKSP